VDASLELLTRLAAGMLVLAASCGPPAPSFRAFDGYAARPTSGTVEVFVHTLPQRPYARVGVIVVEGRRTAKQVVDEAVALARKVGCDLLVARSLVDELGELEPGGLLVAQVGGTLGSPRGATFGARGRESRRNELICGRWSQGGVG
jgi:hypothetical protein